MAAGGMALAGIGTASASSCEDASMVAIRNVPGELVEGQTGSIEVDVGVSSVCNVSVDEVWADIGPASRNSSSWREAILDPIDNDAPIRPGNVRSLDFDWSASGSALRVDGSRELFGTYEVRVHAWDTSGNLLEAETAQFEVFSQQDVDRDGKYEDVNDNGEVESRADPEWLFDNLDSAEVQNDPGYDINGDGEVTTSDVTTLYNELN